MGNEPKVFEIDCVLKGYDSYDKLRDIYSDLREHVFPMDPIQTSDSDTITINNTHRGSQYGWELYKVDDALLVLEFLGNWQGYAHEDRWAPKPTEARMHRMILTLHGPASRLEDAIEKVMMNYPRE